MFNSLTLAGIEAFQEVHGNIDFNMQGVRESDVLGPRFAFAAAASNFGAQIKHNLTPRIDFGGRTAGNAAPFDPIEDDLCIRVAWA